MCRSAASTVDGRVRTDPPREATILLNGYSNQSPFARSDIAHDRAGERRVCRVERSIQVESQFRNVRRSTSARRRESRCSRAERTHEHQRGGEAAQPAHEVRATRSDRVDDLPAEGERDRERDQDRRLATPRSRGSGRGRACALQDALLRDAADAFARAGTDHQADGERQPRRDADQPEAEPDERRRPRSARAPRSAPAGSAGRGRSPARHRRPSRRSAGRTRSHRRRAPRRARPPRPA